MYAQVSHKVTAICERLAAALSVADVRALARVNTLVVHKVAALCEGLAAALEIADVRALTCKRDGMFDATLEM